MKCRQPGFALLAFFLSKKIYISSPEIKVDLSYCIWICFSTNMTVCKEMKV